MVKDSYENYYLSEKNGVTTLNVQMDGEMLNDFCEMMSSS